MPPVAHEADKIRRPDAQLQRKQPHSGGGEGPGGGDWTLPCRKCDVMTKTQDKSCESEGPTISQPP